MSHPLPRRPFGSTGIELSIIGMGGIVVMNEEQSHANQVVAEAVERGVNYFDVSPNYGDAEIKLGPALEPYRKNVFLAGKTIKRRSDLASEELKTSLKRLRTDYLDLYQLHALEEMADVDKAFAKGGCMETLMEAKKSGKVRHLGFSAHSVDAALAAMDRYDFDSIMFPVNFVTYFSEFGPQVMEKAEKKGLARIALKAMARQPWTKENPLKEKYKKCWYEPLLDPHQIELALRFTLGQTVTSALPPGEESLFRQALDMASTFRPLNKQELTELQNLARKLTPLFLNSEHAV